MKDELEDMENKTKTILEKVLKISNCYSLLDVRLLADEIRGLKREFISLFDLTFRYRLFALLMSEAELQAKLAENTIRFGNLSQVAINLKRVIALLEVEIEELKNKENGK